MCVRMNSHHVRMWPGLVTAALLSLTLAIPSTVRAADSLKFLSSTLWSSINGIEVQGDVVYCTFTHGLKALDVSNPGSPRELASLPLPEGAGDLALGQGFALTTPNGIAAYFGAKTGPVVIDISVPALPRVISRLDSLENIWSVCIDGSVGYAGGKESGLYVLDLADPEQARVVGHMPIAAGLLDIEAYSGLVALAAGDSGLIICDASDPTRPAIIGRHPTPAACRTTALAGGFAFAAGFPGLSGKHYGMHILDLSDPLNPHLIGSTRAVVQPVDLTVSWGYVYLAEGRGMGIIDLSDVTEPTYISDYQTWSYMSDLAISGNTAYVGSSYSGRGLDIVDISNPVYPQPLGSYSTPRCLQNVAVFGDRACVTDEVWGLILLDISDPSHPVQLGSSPVWYGGVVAVSDALAYVVEADYYGTDHVLHVFDISDPALPMPISSIALPGDAREMVVTDEFAAIAGGWNNTVLFVDISNPFHPAIQVEYDLGFHVSDLAKAGGYLYVTTIDWFSDTTSGSILAVLDVTDWMQPEEVARLHIPGGARSVAVDMPLATIPTRDSGVFIIDVSRPDSPFVVSRIDSKEYYTAMHGHTAYVASSYDGITAYDLTDPASPRLVDHYDTPGWMQSLEIFDGKLWVAECEGLVILELPCAVELTGDVNGDGLYSAADIIGLVGFLFRGGKAPLPAVEAGDVNCDGDVTTADIVYLVNYLFKGGSAPCDICGS